MQNPATLHGAVPSGWRAATAEEFSRICAVTTVAWLPAWVVAALVCSPPRVALHGWAVLLVRCAGFFLCTMAAGAAGLAAAWLGLRVKPAIGMVRVLLHAAMGWIFLPAILLLEQTRPAWAWLLMAIAAAVTAASLRQMAPVEHLETVPPSDDVLPSLAAPEAYSARLATVRPARAITIAVCAWTALLLLTVGRNPLAAGGVLALGTFLLFWHWFRDSGAVIAVRQRMRWLSGTAVSAWLVCVFLLLPWMLHGGGGFAKAAAAQTRKPGSARRVLPHFSSVILWPPKQRVTKLYFPVTTPATTAGQWKHSLEIPFDGPYLYFEPPDNEPGADAHIAHGLPTEPGVNLTSADGGPLFMRAQQHLTKAIDANCCAELEVAVENADARAGEITLGVLLTDTSAPGEPTAMLGFQSVAPAPPGHPVNETARFATDGAHRLRRFDQITVVVLPSWGHWRGAKIAIEGFTLNPR